MARKQELIQGNHAIALGAFYAGARFYAGYPITPSSEIAEVCARELPGLGGAFMQMEDEIASMGAIIGASLAGVKSFTATSGPGFSLMQENLGVAIMGEVPVVVVTVQRSGPSTGLATKPAQADLMQLRWGRHGDQSLVALIPATVAECFELTVKAFNLSEKYRAPVIVAPDEIVGHMRENYAPPEPGQLEIVDRAQPHGLIEDYRPFNFEDGAVAPLASFGSPYISHITSSMHGEDGYSDNSPDNAGRRISQLHRKLEKNIDDIVMTRSFDLDGCDTLIVAVGSAVRAARAAAKEARQRGRQVGVLQVVTMWPFPEREVRRAASRAETVIVPEMNYSGQLAGEVGRAAPGARLIRAPSFDGRGLTPADITAVL
ncbi:MAG: 2-oxoacid:acceptor oxidoreductase subunit alpha [Candidatus Adiutrix sp.]|jgi:2-oxoglutarate ferredoxin oxidoreductase subunit alpha|nr:2-oxoacid:acceptor oxidoreductase subunit alpha [Candidatus Adiutrix sp.]